MSSSEWLKTGVKALTPLAIRTGFWVGIYAIGPTAVVSTFGVIPLIGTAIALHSSLPELIILVI